MNQRPFFRPFGRQVLARPIRTSQVPMMTTRTPHLVCWDDGVHACRGREVHDDGDAMRPPQPPPREEPPMISPHRNWGDCDLDLEYEDEGSSSSSSSSSNNDRNDRRWRPEPRENSPSSPSTARAAAAAAATTTSASATKRRMNAVASHSDTLPSPKGNEDDVNGNDGYTFDGSTQMTTVARSRRRRSKARLCYWSLALATTGILAFLQREIVWSSTLFAVGGGGAGAGRRVPAAATLELQASFKASSSSSSSSAYLPDDASDGLPAVGAHELTRTRPGAAGSWFPSLGVDDAAVGGNAEALSRIGIVDVNQKYGADNFVNSTRHVTFVGFLRITKTASTALLDFLNRRAPHWVTYDYFLDYPTYFKEVSFGDFRSTRCNIPACVFGGGVHPHAVPSVLHRMSASSLQRANLSVGETMLPRYAWQCPHTRYPNLVATWARGISYLDTKPPSTLPQATSATLQVFTIVRDPTERFVSYFHYWRQIYPHWKDLATPEEHALLANGDLEGFVHLQSQLNETITINSAFQYRYLADSADEAVAMVRDSPARVLVLINECFELSLHLLAQTFPQFVDPTSVRNFLEETARRRYTQGNASIPIVTRATSEMGPVQPYRLDPLRRKSRTWLADDYRFYDAAVDAFRSRLAASPQLDPGAIQDCYRRLDARRVDAPSTESGSAT